MNLNGKGINIVALISSVLFYCEPGGGSPRHLKHFSSLFIVAVHNTYKSHAMYCAIVDYPCTHVIEAKTPQLNIKITFVVVRIVRADTSTLVIKIFFYIYIYI